MTEPQPPLKMRAVVKLTQFLCPRCGRHYRFNKSAPQAIFNATEKGILTTLVCPGCDAIVQVWTAGETYHELTK